MSKSQCHNYRMIPVAIYSEDGEPEHVERIGHFEFRVHIVVFDSKLMVSSQLLFLGTTIQCAGLGILQSDAPEDNATVLTLFDMDTAKEHAKFLISAWREWMQGVENDFYSMRQYGWMYVALVTKVVILQQETRALHKAMEAYPLDYIGTQEYLRGMLTSPKHYNPYEDYINTIPMEGDNA